MMPGGDGAHDVPELELEFPPKPEFVGTARHAVSALVRLRDLPDDLVQDVKLAVSEACTTAIADGPGEGLPIRMVVTAGVDRVMVEVIDPGTGVERAVSGSPTEIDTDELPFDRALSLPIIRGLVDEVAITPLEGQGMSLRMVLSVSRTDADGRADA
ncbi:MAG TPA: ATP-binding protein [Actinomycetota bacterium]|jgi:serine/threonine-protein kinase RsbW|nr:ATP-binding protein [Actinomycetota bacterium]